VRVKCAGRGSPITGGLDHGPAWPRTSASTLPMSTTMMRARSRTSTSRCTSTPSITGIEPLDIQLRRQGVLDPLEMQPDSLGRIFPDTNQCGSMIKLMTKLTTISVTIEQHEQLKEMANSEGIAMWELVERFLRRERRRRIGQMLIETNAVQSDEERLFEAAVAAAGSRSVRDALR
jgi:hypothetical protein